MAIVAIADRCKLSPPFDQVGIKGSRRRRIDRSNRRSPGDGKRRSGAAQQQHGDDAPNDTRLFHAFQ
jgi:hypothetical protein